MGICIVAGILAACSLGIAWRLKGIAEARMLVAYNQARTAESERLRAQAAERSAVRQVAVEHWREAEREARPVTAGLHLMIAANAFHQTEEQRREMDALDELAALRGMAVCSFPTESRTLGAKLNDDGSRVLNWSDDGTVQLWSVWPIQCLRSWKNAGPVSGATFSRDGLCVLTWGTDGTARQWNAGSDLPVRLFQHGSPVDGALFDEDERRVLTWSRDGAARSWHPFVCAHPPTCRTATRYCGSCGSAMRERGEARLRDRSRFDLLEHRTGRSDGRGYKFKDAVLGASTTEDGFCVLTCSTDGTVRLCDMLFGGVVRQWKHNAEVAGAAFSGDASKVLTWTTDGTTWLWSVTSDQPLRKWRDGSIVKGAEFSRNSSRVFTRTADGTIRLWDVSADAPLRQWKNERELTGAAFNADASGVLAWGRNVGASGWITLWDVSLHQPAWQWEHENAVLGATFNRDDSRILIWSNDGPIRLLDVSMKPSLRQLEHDGDISLDRSTSPDERLLEYEVRAAITLDSEGRPTQLKFGEWEAKRSELEELRFRRAKDR